MTDRGAARGRTWTRGLLGVAVSIISLSAVVWWATRQERPDFPTAAEDLGPLALALAVYGGVTMLRGWRWHHVLRHTGIGHPTFDAYGLVAVGYMGNNVLPARGGEVLRVLLMGERIGGRRLEIVGSVVAERLLDVLTIVTLFSAMTFAGVAGAPIGRQPVALALAGAAVVVLVVALLVRLRRTGRLQRVAELARPLVRASHLLLGRVGALLLLATAAIWLLEGSIYRLIGASLDVHISFVEAIFLVLLVSFAAAVPSAPGYLGTFDAAVIFGLDALGVEGGDAVAFAVLVRFLAFVPITIAGLVLVLVRYGGLTRILRPARPNVEELGEAAHRQTGYRHETRP
ncbi:MAG: lysylphosphatidylglycerol synthase transmembrane domain-containing protein [Gaiellaceae bacterium]